MAEIKAKKKVGLYRNEESLIRLDYVFDDDAGAIGVLEMLDVDEAMVIVDAWIDVLEAVTSGGDPTVEVGIDGGDTDAILPATLKGALLIDTTIDADSAAKKLRVAKDAKISLEIKVAALTAGKIRVNLLVVKF